MGTGSDSGRQLITLRSGAPGSLFGPSDRIINCKFYEVLTDDEEPVFLSELALPIDLLPAVNDMVDVPGTDGLIKSEYLVVGRRLLLYQNPRECIVYIANPDFEIDEDFPE
jgi:hypothetical protein